MTLRDVAKVLRSKNAGPFCLTIDILFEDPKTFGRVSKSATLTPAKIAELYGIAERDCRIIPFPPAHAIKITMPRQTPSGSLLDTDILGAQQHAHLLDLEVSL